MVALRKRQVYRLETGLQKIEGVVSRFMTCLRAIRSTGTFGQS